MRVCILQQMYQQKDGDPEILFPIACTGMRRMPRCHRAAHVCNQIWRKINNTPQLYKISLFFSLFLSLSVSHSLSLFLSLSLYLSCSRSLFSLSPSLSLSLPLSSLFVSSLAQSINFGWIDLDRKIWDPGKYILPPIFLKLSYQILGFSNWDLFYPDANHHPPSSLLLSTCHISGSPVPCLLTKKKKTFFFLFIIHHERTTRNTCVVDRPDSDGMCSKWLARKQRGGRDFANR